jgi:biotin transport system ATP-binding protein
MLEISALSRRFPDSPAPALQGVSFSVNERDCIVISGANGSGKSVLMSLIAGLDRPTSGTVTSCTQDKKNVRVGLVLQNADAQILGDTPLEDVAFGPRNLGFSRDESRAIALRVLSEVGLAGKENTPARSLSGGEKRRLAVAGILAMDAGLIVFDEPFANLDWPGVVQVNGIIRKLKDDGKTIIILTHELEKVLALANRLLVLYRGELVYDGLPDEALRSAPLESWGIRNPLARYETHQDLIWS